MAGRRQASVGEDKPSPTKVAAVTAPSKKSERPTAAPAALRPLFFHPPKIEIMFTTGRTQPGVPCRHLLLLPVALCGPSAGRIFALSGRLLGFLPVYFCVRFSLVFSLSAFGRRARFGPSGAIFFLLSFLRGLPSGLLSCFLISFVFLGGFLSFISLVSLSILFSALFHSFSLGTSVLWLFPYIFLFYFYIFLFVRLSICGRVG